jgi:hypothetical protein
MLSVLLLAATLAYAQPARSVVVDQTGLPLPGVRIDVYRGDDIVQSLTTEGDGGFTLAPGRVDDIIAAVLDGFATTRVPRTAADKIVMQLAGAHEVTDVIASELVSSGSAMEHLGSTMSAPLALKLPMARPRILQALPLLPAVVRGRDGLLRIGGTRPHESSLWIDGFDVTDPVTGTTAIDLPNESVKGMAVVREPVSATFSGVLGSMASIETTAGTGEFRAGVQGFIPRPRLNHQYGLGRIEAFYPRAYAGGHIGQRTHFFASAELNFERVPVPGVTNQSGTPAAGASGVTTFARMDVDLTRRNTLSVEGLFLPATTSYSGLSPLQQPAAAPNVSTRDLFGGVVDRVVLGPTDLLTLRVGVLNHTTKIEAAGAGAAVLAPDGWQQNWFSQVDTAGTRRSASLTWDRAGIAAAGTHTFSAMADVQQRTMSATMQHQTIQIQDDDGRLMRSIDFATLPGPVAASDTSGGFGLRDLWDVTSRLQIDLDLRLDWYPNLADMTPSPRIGVRYILNETHRTTVKASAGRFVGRAPLGAVAFPQFPARTDIEFDPATGAVIHSAVYTPTGTFLELPRADGVALEFEHQIRPGLEAQAAARARYGRRLPTVTVSPDGGEAVLASTGTSTYREVQVSLRQTWSADRQVFVSYVHSMSRGDLNDFGSLFSNLDTPLFEPGVAALTATDSPDRLRAWATFALPLDLVVSPAAEWRTGFPYSVQDEYRHYIGTPNSERLPAFFALDLTTYKTFEVFHQNMDLGLQVFNLTNHFNPRDVITVAESPRFRELTNNPGITFGGYMQIRW